jgi:superfamily II DNA/RNA helicase
MKHHTPTEIQQKTIPFGLAGKDILGSSQTGSGKTVAFSVPLVAKLLENPNATALVLTPTRELATQVLTVIHNLLGKGNNINTALLIGGDSIAKQIEQLNKKARIIVGTPGRVNDHLLRKTLKLKNTTFLVLDETDRMLDMGFGIQLDAIVKHLPTERQTLMFSATMPRDIEQLSAKYLRDPERVAIGSVVAIASNLVQEVRRITEANKYDELLKELGVREGSIIVFVKTKHSADNLANKLYRNEFQAKAIHGDLQQRKRERVIQDYRFKKFNILVATDVAARGLDIPHIEHVIIYDVPHSPEDYIHRLGRTARNGMSGSAITFLSPEDGKKWRAISRMLNPGDADNNSRDSSNRSYERKNDRKSSFAGRKAPRAKADNQFYEGLRTENRVKPFGFKQPRVGEGNGRSFEGRADRPFGFKQPRVGEGNGRSFEGRADRSFGFKQPRVGEGNGRSFEGRAGKPFKEKFVAFDHKPSNKPFYNNNFDTNSFKPKRTFGGRSKSN